jgi:hypothetical protein
VILGSVSKATIGVDPTQEGKEALEAAFDDAVAMAVSAEVAPLPWTIADQAAGLVAGRYLLSNSSGDR